MSFGIKPPDDGYERRKDYLNVDARLSEIDIKLAILINQTEANHKSIRESVQRNENEINKHDVTLFGNGHPGLTSKIERLKDLKDSMDSHILTDKWMFTTVIGLLIVILGKIFVDI